jgi:hypothetical protein
MGRHASILTSFSGTWPLVLATAIAAGCSLTAENPPAEPRLTDAMGDGIRGIPDEQPDTLAASHKKPFWEKYRDKRVQQINEHLNVEEPDGW